MYQQNQPRLLGFTLIEVLVTITIIGILVSIVVYGFAYDLTNSRDQQRLTNIASISNALEQFYTDHHGYPTLTATTSGNYVYNATMALDYAVGGKCYSGKQEGDFLAPDYMASVPQDPKDTLSAADIAGCSDNTNTQNPGQYLYLPVSSSTTGLPQSFEITAKMELSKNMAAAIPNGSEQPLSNNNAYYSQFLTVMSPNTACFNQSPSQANCYANSYLGPKVGD